MAHYRGHGSMTNGRSWPHLLRPRERPAVDWPQLRGTIDVVEIATGVYLYNRHVWSHTARPVYKVKVTLRLTVSQSVCLGVVPRLGHMTSNLFGILIL
jgi:hypothetical protein